MKSTVRIEPEANLPDINEAANLCRALAHPARIRILCHLLQVDRCICGRIVEIMPLAQSTVSQHLRILKEAGLIRGEVEGPRTCYCVDRDRLACMGRLLARMLQQGENDEQAP